MWGWCWGSPETPSPPESSVSAHPFPVITVDGPQLTSDSHSGDRPSLQESCCLDDMLSRMAPEAGETQTSPSLLWHQFLQLSARAGAAWLQAALCADGSSASCRALLSSRGWYAVGVFLEKLPSRRKFCVPSSSSFQQTSLLNRPPREAAGLPGPPEATGGSAHLSIIKSSSGFLPPPCTPGGEPQDSLNLCPQSPIWLKGMFDLFIQRRFALRDWGLPETVHLRSRSEREGPQRSPLALALFQRRKQAAGKGCVQGRQEVGCWKHSSGWQRIERARGRGCLWRVPRAPMVSRLRCRAVALGETLQHVRKDCKNSLTSPQWEGLPGKIASNRPRPLGHVVGWISACLDEQRVLDWMGRGICNCSGPACSVNSPPGRNGLS